ncbi:uncharacterized protein M437DRAFT_36469 [Aureobasidium melanogenum CBS 110374]|uniref:Uncharacterized protein n=1 Tax=Aureobasidium melanogenum (strain CBS 110374) TaxID=1043003 RepID=A0A074WCY9_AURM1|nr:uncharacterized protein M437DRAFT_36469 [Aureobasidium melanogenum CBS 110374]KEQ67772.1 hypothetical protein M437DRAFT_36469 [Aureobasidium melanogenum CBS 110374]
MENASHSRNASADHHSYALILEHILSDPATYELPLRTMYTINSTPAARAGHSLSHTRTRENSIDSRTSESPTSPNFPFRNDTATESLSTNLMAQMASLPSQPTSLPPSFITAFLRKAFSADLRFVDFPQALTGLDYLKDLETRRRREVAAALECLGIDRNTIGAAEEELSRRYPGVLSWFRTLEEKERKIEALYTQVYVALRRWVLINELSLTPFNKHNCIAMLNTLYPPIVSSQPTSKLTPGILKKQRDTFFKYIQAVEKSGPAVLINLIQQGKKPTDENGWASTRNTLDMYLQVANSLISECQEILYTDTTSIIDSAETKRKGRKVDSGISFPESDHRRPSSSSSKSSKNSFSEDAPVNEMRRKSSSGILRTSGLMKFAREMKNMGFNRTDIRSFSNLGGLRSGNSSSTSLASSGNRSDVPHFDADEMKRQRLIYEANAAKQQKP